MQRRRSQGDRGGGWSGVATRNTKRHQELEETRDRLSARTLGGSRRALLTPELRLLSSRTGRGSILLCPKVAVIGYCSPRKAIQGQNYLCQETSFLVRKIGTGRRNFGTDEGGGVAVSVATRVGNFQCSAGERHVLRCGLQDVMAVSLYVLFSKCFLLACNG